MRGRKYDMTNRSERMVYDRIIAQGVESDITISHTVQLPLS